MCYFLNRNPDSDPIAATVTGKIQKSYHGRLMWSCDLNHLPTCLKHVLRRKQELVNVACCSQVVHKGSAPAAVSVDQKQFRHQKGGQGYCYCFKDAFKALFATEKLLTVRGFIFRSKENVPVLFLSVFFSVPESLIWDGDGCKSFFLLILILCHIHVWSGSYFSSF